MPYEPSGSLHHHFLEGRKVRADELGEMAGHRNWWRSMAFLMVVWSFLALGTIVYLGSLPRQVPYYIRWDSTTGDMTPLGLAPQAPTDPATIRLWLREFVWTLRTLSSDKEVIRQAWNRMMVRVTPEGRGKIVAYQEEWKPLIQTETQQVEILHMLPQTKRSWDVRWKETRFDAHDGHVLTTTIQRGLFTFTLRVPKTPDELDLNPAGIFFDTWGWNRE